MKGTTLSTIIIVVVVVKIKEFKGIALNTIKIAVPKLLLITFYIFVYSNTATETHVKVIR